MQIKIFTIPVTFSSSQEEEINRFLRSHRVLTVDRHFSSEDGGYWSLLVTYQENGSPEAPFPVSRNGKKDYRELLDDGQFALFARLKDVRREIAKQENIPAYAVFTDDELSQIVQLKEMTVDSMKSIKGIGKRAEKYGEMFLQKNASAEDETGGTPF